MVTSSLEQAVLQLSQPVSSAASHRVSRSLCHDSEGWGPASPGRFDVTPCFLDAWILGLAVLGGLAGAGAILYLCKKRKPAPVRKNWHFHAKVV